MIMPGTSFRRIALAAAAVSSLAANLPLLYLLWRHHDQPRGLDALAGLIGQSPNQFLFLPILFPLIAFFTASVFWLGEELRARAPLRRGWLRLLFASPPGILLLGLLVSILAVGRDYLRKPFSEHELFYLDKQHAWMAGLANQVVFRERDPMGLLEEGGRWVDTADARAIAELRDLPQRFVSGAAVPSPEEGARYLALCYRPKSTGVVEALPLDPIMRKLDFLALMSVHLAAWVLVSYVFVMMGYRRATPIGGGIFVRMLRLLACGIGLYAAWLGLRWHGMAMIEHSLLRPHSGKADLVPVLGLVSLLFAFLAYLLITWLKPPNERRMLFFVAQILPALLPALIFGVIGALGYEGLLYLIGPGLEWDRLLITFILMFIVVGLLIVADSSSAPLRTADFPIIRHCLFVSYSHKDAAWCLLFKKFLEPRIRRGELVVWLDQSIISAEDFRMRIRHAIDASRAVLLLVSSRFVAESEFIIEEEIPYLRQTRDALGESFKVFWVKIDDCSFSDRLIDSTQSLADPFRPLDRLPIRDLDTVLANAAEEIAAALRS